MPPASQSSLSLSDFDYALPGELIAQAPLPTRSASRLLHVSGERLADRRFADLPELLEPLDLLVLNDTRVIKARLAGTKQTGGRAEILVERVLADDALLCQVRASHPPRPGMRITVDGGFDIECTGRDGRMFRFRVLDRRPVWELLERFGSVPLPPYIERPAVAEDRERYQTVYASTPGAVAAPTAGLHFDRELLARIAAKGIDTAYLTLHVGAGTFLPVTDEDLSRHRMHAEWFTIPEATAQAVRATRQRRGRVVAVGTTTLRALEAAARDDGTIDEGARETSLFVTPGFRFRAVDRLLTNFHLPRSTLLMLVCAFGGYEQMLAAYRHAVAARYRFFSYGDAMLIEGRHGTTR